MTERSLTPSPHRAQNLERGVFSSLSTLSLYKQTVEERKQQCNSIVVAKKSPLAKPRSPVRVRPVVKKVEKSPETRSPLKIQNRLREDTESKPDIEVLKLQDSLKSLNLQLAREKRINSKLENELKEMKNSHKAEIANLQTNYDKVYKSLQNLMSVNSSLAIEKEKLAEEIKKVKETYEETKDHVKSIGCVLVSILSTFFLNYEEDLTLLGQEKLRICGRIKDLVSEKLAEIEKSTNIDFSRQLNEIRGWLLITNFPKQSEKTKKKVEDPPEISYTVEYFNDTANSLGSTNEFLNPVVYTNDSYRDEVSFNQEPKSAIALYDFEGEREEDLAFFSGDTIEILEECQNGWWIGRLHGKTGSFPFNFVQII